MSEPPRARIQSIGRAKALLDAMGDGGWVSLRDLAARTGLAKTTTFNLVGALTDVGLAERDATAGAYRLGLQHLIYGRSVERRLDIVSIARPHLVHLCAETRETVNIAVPRPADAIIVESLEGTQSLRVSSYSGTRAPYHSTACGRALLANQPLKFRQSLYDQGPLAKPGDRTITDPDALEDILAQCRQLGWTVEQEENEIGNSCIAAPIFGPGGEAIAAISIACPTARLDEKAIERFGALLLAELAKITAELPVTTSVSGSRALA